MSKFHTAEIWLILTLNINRLIRKSKGKKVTRRKLTTLKAAQLSREAKTGFEHERYKKVDINIPVLITKSNVLLDGRHRLCRLFDMGKIWVNVIVMSDAEIEDCEFQRRYL